MKRFSSHRRRDSGEMTKSLDEDGHETAKISVSTGTIGGGAPAASNDDPPDKETFQVEIGIEHNECCSMQSILQFGFGCCSVRIRFTDALAFAYLYYEYL